MDDRFSEVLRSRRRHAEERTAKPRKPRLTSQGKKLLATRKMRPWSPSPGIEDLVGYEEGGPRREELMSAFLSVACQLRDGDSTPVLLFQGRPGVGKSHVAAAIARSGGMEAHTLRKNEIVNAYLGEPERNFTKFLLSRAADYRTSGIYQMVVIDEADSVFTDRDEFHKGWCPLTGVFNEFVNGARHQEIGNSLVFVLCVNRPELLERSVVSRALVVTFTPPTVGEVERLLIYHSVAKGVSVEADVDFGQLARRIVALDMTHRDVTHVVATAQAKAVMRGLGRVGAFDVRKLAQVVGKGVGGYAISQEDFLGAIEARAKARGDVQEDKGSAEELTHYV